MKFVRGDNWQDRKEAVPRQLAWDGLFVPMAELDLMPSSELYIYPCQNWYRLAIDLRVLGLCEAQFRRAGAVI
jgi:hypothetical protein